MHTYCVKKLKSANDQLYAVYCIFFKLDFFGHKPDLLKYGIHVHVLCNTDINNGWDQQVLVELWL